MKRFQSLLNRLTANKEQTAEPEAEQKVVQPARSRASAKGQFICGGKFQADAKDSDRTVFELFRLDADGNLISKLARPNAKERISTFTVSPDAHWVAYTCHVRRDEGHEPFPEIRAVSVDGNKSCTLTRWDSHFQPCYLNPVFSPRGDKLVCEFALENPYNPNLVVLRLEEIGDSLYGGREDEIANRMRIGNHAPCFMSDGKRIVYFGNYAYEDLLEVCLYDPNKAGAGLLDSSGERLTEQAHGVWHRPNAIAVQPEWEQVFFIRGHTQPHEDICVFSLTDIPKGAVLKRFTSIGGEYHRIRSLQISSDGKWLAFDGDDSIYVIATDGSELRQLTPDHMSCRGPAFSQDGSKLAFLSQGELYTVGVQGDQLQQLTGGELGIDEFVWT